ncbi:MAG TPA: M56 family metallopeptidase, partial [Thermoanaerobaculia bacterium]|nr:M56 family metallopeptidase [Thermoanaerobaculia bacterium]
MFDLSISGLVPAIPSASQVTAWLLTYLLHSTLFLAFAWLAARGPLRRRPALEEAAWRFALMAALVTASVQLAAGYTPLAGRWGLATPAAGAERVEQVAPAASSAPLASTPLHLPASPAGRIALRSAEAAVRPAAPARPLPWPALFAGLWLAGAVALGARWLAAHLYLSRRLRARPEVVGGDMHGILHRLAGEAGLGEPVRLSCSSRLPVPIALGLRRREICVPPRALASLSPEQQEGMLAHELAHLVRRDPFWLAFSHFLSSVLFFQPLNHVARRRLRELSELRSDEWAVGQTGRPLSLARCLTEVAGWSFQPLGSLVAPGMADRPSHLAHRIRRLLSDDRAENRVRPLWLAAGMAVLLMAVIAAAPGVAPAASNPPSPASPPAVVATAAGSGPAVVASSMEQPRGSQEPRGPQPEIASKIKAEEDADRAGDVDLSAPELADRHPLDPLESIASLAAADAQLANIYDREHLSEEEARALDEQLRTVNEQIEKSVQPSLQEAEKRLQEVMKEFENSPALKDLEARAKELEQKAQLSEAEIEKIKAQAEEMTADSKRFNPLTPEQKAAIRKQVQDMAEQSHLTAKDRAELDELTRKVREEQQRFMKEHALEIETMRKQIREQAAAMREEIRRTLDANPQLKALRERQSSETEKRRDEMRQKRDADRKKSDEDRQRRKKEKEDHSGAVSGGVQGGIPGGVKGG